MAEINIALECFCMVLSLVLLGSLVLNGDRSSHYTRLFLATLVCNLLFLGGDAWAWYWNGTEAVFWNRAGNLIQYLAGYGLLLFYCVYLLARLSQWGAWRRVQLAVLALCGAGVGLTLLSQGTGLFYTITPDNLFRRGPAFWLAEAIALAALALVGVVMAVCWKDLPQEEGRAVLLYLLLPMAMLGGDLLWEELSLLGLGTTLTLMLVFVNVQLQRDRRLREQDKELAQKKIAIMLSQIQPHFLFNILGSIEWLCETDPPKAQEATDELARFLRGNMDSLQSTSTIPASRELEHVRCYLNLERIRFGSHLRVEYDIGPTDFFLPALSLQPLVENAVRHGVTKREEGGTIRVSTSQTVQHYLVTIRDDGVGFDPDSPKEDGRDHVGIENVRSRLAAQCGGSLVIGSRPGAGTVAQVRIPKKGKSQGKEEHHAHSRS